MRPFLKWAGGKYRLVERIKAVLPPGKRLIEPFVGSGAMFLNTDYPAYLLADTNADLINLYCRLQTEGEAFITYCRTFFRPETNEKEWFYELRIQFNQTSDQREKAALFVYLNKHCFNGLCRYNSKGQFNVPFGRYKQPYFPETEMRFFWQKAQQAEFIVSDFVATMESAQPGDVVYCDPPYVPLSDTANFTSYGELPFGEVEQRKLGQVAEKLAQRGVTVVISNHDTRLTQEIYSRANRKSSFPVQRFISCDGANRSKVDELLAIYEGRPDQL